jgi:hypothetical protein
MKIDKFLTTVKPGTLAIIIVVIAAGLYFLFKKKKTDASQAAVDSVNVNSNKLSFTTAELQFKTSELLDAMNQYGTDFDTIISVLKSLRTSDDLLYIVKAFGTKPYYLTGLGDGILSRYMSTDENLIGWFHEELGIGELAQVQAQFDRLGVSMI